MALANAVDALKIVGALAAIVPVFGPQLEAMINVANELCGVADGVQSNREGFVDLAHEAAVYAAAVADSVQRSHPPVTMGAPVSADQTTPADSTSPAQIIHPQKHIEALTETLKEIQKVASERKTKDDARAKKFASGLRRAVRDTVRKGHDQETLNNLRTKLGLAVKAFSIAADVHGADMLRGIAEQMEVTSRHQETLLKEEVERRVRWEAEVDERHRKEAFEAEKRRREDVLKHLETKLTPAHDARHDSGQAPSGCMANTRVKLLAELESWISSNGDRIYWLSGLAGTGKSTVASSLCTLLAKLGLLAGSFFVSRNSADRRDAKSITRTLAFQLSRQFPAVQEHLHTLLVEHPDTLSRPINDLFIKLIVDPLANLVWSASAPLIVIDAFDECDMQEGREGGGFLPQLLAAIRRGSLPLRLFVTSRPHPSIEKMFTGTHIANNDSYLSLKLHNIEQSIVQRDIEVYFETSFRRIARMEPELADHTWPEPSTLKTLVTQAGVLFIYAATVVRYVEDPADVPSERLRSLFNRTSPSTGLEYEMLDELYLQILKGCVGKEKDRNSPLSVRLRVVAGSLVHLQDPLSLGSLSGLLNMERAAVRRMLESLSSLLIYDPRKPVRLFHPSFPDFISNADRCHDLQFYVVAEEQHTFLALRCISVMNHYLKYDICGIGDPSWFNSEISNLPERLTRNVPAELAYACKHWMAHLSQSSVVHVDVLLNELRNFSENHLLHWIEVLSLLAELPSAPYGLPGTIKWCRTVGDAAFVMTSLLSDAERTLQEYYTPISASALQIYHSALTFMPHCSLWRVSSSTSYHTPRLSSQRHPKWSALLRVLEGHKDGVNSVTFSRDGTRLASGSGDATVCVWDVNTGNVIATYNGHNKAVRSVAFSPDGTRVALGSLDGSVRVWDTSTGEIVATVGTEMRCVVFSPDGTRLALGSYGKTIYVCDANTGNTIKRLDGHKEAVLSVAFSPDGTGIASGSVDRTVRVWDANMGDTIAMPNDDNEAVFSFGFSLDDTPATPDMIGVLYGHDSGVNSVAFSPGGTHLASGSDDSTVRTWDANTGDIIATLNGHKEAVLSVAFSPGGARLASGSSDTAVRVWDANTGDIIATLDGHNRAVNSVAFSPDSTRIASGSSDATVRVWNANTSDIVATLNGHDKAMYSMAFSSDGTRLASGSGDTTVRVWDANTGDIIATLNGHYGAVISVRFSPDGTRLASGSDDTTVRVWNVNTGEAIATLNTHTEWLYHVSWSHNGSEIFYEDSDGAHRIWRAEDDFPILVHDSADGPTLPYAQFTFSVDQPTGWASCTRTTDNYTKRVCWVPSSRRPAWRGVCIQAGARVAMGADSGAMTILDLTDWLSTWMSV